MFKGRSILLLSTAVLLAACQGNSQSESGSTNTDINSLQPGTLCPTGSTLTLSGVEIDVDRFDVNNSGCLEPGELDNVNDYVSEENAYRISLLEKKVTGTNNTSELSSVLAMSVIGNAAVSDGKAQIHSNISDGQVMIRVDTHLTGPSTEFLAVVFDDQSYSSQANTEPEHGYAFSKPPISGYATFALVCDYNNDFSLSCTDVLIYQTGHPETGVYTRKLTETFDLNLTFDSAQLPQSGLITASFCAAAADADSDARCFRNYAEVPVSFN